MKILSTTHLRSAVAIVAIIFIATGQIVACPLCDSQTAHNVRSELIGEGMGKTLMAIITPLAVLLVGLRIYCVGSNHFFRFTSK